MYLASTRLCIHSLQSRSDLLADLLVRIAIGPVKKATIDNSRYVQHLYVAISQVAHSVSGERSCSFSPDGMVSGDRSILAGVEFQIVVGESSDPNVV